MLEANEKTNQAQFRIARGELNGSAINCRLHIREQSNCMARSWATVRCVSLGSRNGRTPRSLRPAHRATRAPFQPDGIE